jgi:hypothetical protein
MRNTIKLFGIIALVAVIGFSFIGCDFLTGDGNGTDSGAGTTIHVKNSTGYNITNIWDGLYIKPDTETKEWGSAYSSSGLMATINDGETKKVTLSQPLSAHKVYDFRIHIDHFASFYGDFVKFGVTVTNGMTITIDQSDLYDLGSLPKIVILNRSGKSFDSVFIKPSVSDEWGNSFGDVRNNSYMDASIQIPPSNYTVFDIQMKSSSPTNTYTKNGVTISNGMELLFTSADAETSYPSEPPVIVIENKTGQDITNIYDGLSIRPTGTTEDDWDRLLNGLDGFGNESSKAFTLTGYSVGQSIDIQIHISHFAGFNGDFEKSNVQIVEGMVVTITASDVVSE